MKHAYLGQDLNSHLFATLANQLLLLFYSALNHTGCGAKLNKGLLLGWPWVINID
jgi:hypothetical protein